MIVGLTVKAELTNKATILARVLRVLRNSGATVLVDEGRCGVLKGCKPLSLQSSPIHALIVIGGDGTIFRAVRELEGRAIPIIGINRGAIGFLAEVDVEEIGIVLPKLLTGTATKERRHVLYIAVRRGRKTIFTGYALNEAVIAQGAIARLLDLRTTVENEELTTYRADGLILATPTGSTAYSLSAGGPIVHPQLSAIILTPLNPHAFSQKPIVIPGRQSISIEVHPKRNRYVDSAVSLTLDGQTYVPLQQNDVVSAKIGRDAVTFLRRKEDTFVATLRRKLKWGDRP